MSAGGEPAFAWLPPFVVGACAAVAGEVAGGLLLYSGDGFLRALTIILATILGALAIGLWTAPSPPVERPVETLRRRWLVALVAFALAAVTAAGWSVLGGFASRPASRGVGLALLAAAPLYGAGALLGAMGAVRTDLGMRGPGGPAAAGAAAGAVFTGGFLMRAAAPFSLHVLALVALSAAALVHGHLLDRLLPGEHREAEGDAAPAALADTPPSTVPHAEPEGRSEPGP